MALSEELTEARNQAELAVLQSIKTVLQENAHAEVKARTVLNLAESFAWLRSTAQPHGGGSAAKSN